MFKLFAAVRNLNFMTSMNSGPKIKLSSKPNLAVPATPGSKYVIRDIKYFF